jgi:hypothetical protein
MVKDAKISTLGEEANDIFVLVPINENFQDSDFFRVEGKIEEKVSELYN